jgi:hypothetical protein
MVGAPLSTVVAILTGSCTFAGLPSYRAALRSGWPFRAWRFCVNSQGPVAALWLLTGIRLLAMAWARGQARAGAALLAAGAGHSPGRPAVRAIACREWFHYDADGIYHALSHRALAGC